MRAQPPPAVLDEASQDALRLLARGLAGAAEVAHLEGFPWGPALAAAVRTSAAQAPVAAPAPTDETTAPEPRSPATMATTATTAIVSTLTTTMAASTGPTPAAARATAPAVAAMTTGAPADRLRVLCDEVIGACTRCKLHRGRNRIVFGAGSPEASLVFVGEGPGADEDREGVPFVGAAGQLLTRMIEAMGLRRDDVYICNVVKCRPPNNRDPEPDEVAACGGFLREQLAILQPRVIVGLGRYACQTLLQTQTPISKLRGRWHRYEGIDVMPTFHPSYLLREERDPTKARKREAWSDLKLVMDRLGLPTRG